MKTLLRTNLLSLTAFAVMLPILPTGLAGHFAPAARPGGEPGVAAVNLSTNSVQAGQRVQGVVKLDAPATELTTVTLTSSIPTVAKPALSSVTIKPDSSVAFFEVNTRNVALRPVSLVITASANGTSKSAPLSVLPK